MRVHVHTSHFSSIPPSWVSSLDTLLLPLKMGTARAVRASPLWPLVGCLSLRPVETKSSLIFHLSRGLTPLRVALMWGLLLGVITGFLRSRLGSAHGPLPRPGLEVS